MCLSRDPVSPVNATQIMRLWKHSSPAGLSHDPWSENDGITEWGKKDSSTHGSSTGVHWAPTPRKVLLSIQRFRDMFSAPLQRGKQETQQYWTPNAVWQNRSTYKIQNSVALLLIWGKPVGRSSKRRWSGKGLKDDDNNSGGAGGGGRDDGSMAVKCWVSY